MLIPMKITNRIDLKKQWDTILELTVEGKSLNSIAKLLDFRAGLFFEMLTSAPDLQAGWVRAKECQADMFAEQMIDTIESMEAGQMSFKVAEVSLKGRQWIAGKLKPTKYAERIEAHITSNVNITQILVDARKRLQGTSRKPMVNANPVAPVVEIEHIVENRRGIEIDKKDPGYPKYDKI
jgi:hypothetical protein